MVDDKKASLEEGSSGPGDCAEPTRRKALLKIGKYGAYVAPAVLAIIIGGKAEGFCSLC